MTRFLLALGRALARGATSLAGPGAFTVTADTYARTRAGLPAKDTTR